MEILNKSLRHNVYPLAPLLLSLGLSSCSYLDNQDIKENLQLAPGQTLTLKDAKGNPVQLQGGPVTLHVEAKHFFTDSTFQLKTPQGNFTFKIPKSAFLDKRMAISANARVNGQPVKIAGNISTRVLSTRMYQGTRSCTTPDFCYHQETGTDSKGNMTSNFVYGYYYACDEKQDALFEVKTLVDSYGASFSSPDSGEQVAQMNGDGTPYTDSTLVKTLTSCGQTSGTEGYISRAINDTTNQTKISALTGPASIAGTRSIYEGQNKPDVASKIVDAQRTAGSATTEGAI